MSAGNDPVWQWPLDRIRQVTGAATAGRDLTPDSWPDGARVAVALSFDFDAETSWVYRDLRSPAAMSRGAYGARVGVPRILDALREVDVLATFFVPAVAGHLHSDRVDAIVESGHEIGVHGWIHEVAGDLTPDVERELLTRSFEFWADRLGSPPAGIRTPSWDFTPDTLGILKDLGFVYDSSLMGDDRPYELLDQGEPTGLVELPVEWLLDDFPYLQIMRERNMFPHIKPADVLEIWKREFDAAREEGTMLLLTMHPQVIGHRSRWGMLKDLLAYLKEQPGVWFARHDEIARLVSPAATA